MNTLTPTSARRPFSRLHLMAAAASLLCAAPAFSQGALDYAGRWTFDDCLSSTPALKDSSGANATATRGSLVQCTTDALGRLNGAVNLPFSRPGDGTPQTNVVISNPTALAISGKLALSANIRPTTTTEGTILTKGWTSPTAGAQKTFQLAIVKDAAGVRRLSFTVWFKPASGTVAVPVTLISTGAVKLADWSQVGASYDPADGNMKVFIAYKTDKPQVTSRAETRLIADAPAGTATSVWMGGGTPSQTNGYTGGIDDVWVSNGSCIDFNDGRDADRERELIIGNLSVVNDDRTKGAGQPTTNGKGKWSFGWLMEQMVSANPVGPQSVEDAASDMVLEMLNTWRTRQPPLTVNGLLLPPRDNIVSLVIDTWPKRISATDGTEKLDLALAPMRLQAITNRMDLRNIDNLNAGEGRFVFGVLTSPTPTNSTPRALPFTIILEYKLHAKTEADTRIWARDWHKLGELDPLTAAYKTALESLTDRFSLRGAALFNALPNLNGNTLSQLRTNEIALSNPWELRQFQLVKEVATGATRLAPAAVTQTPDVLLVNKQPLLTTYINENASNILKQAHLIPVQFQGQPFLAATSRNSGLRADSWNASNIVAPAGERVTDVRHRLALNTCNGCHSGAETGAFFLHIGTREANAPSTLSRFLTGKDFNGLPFELADAVDAKNPDGTAVKRLFDDLGERQKQARASLGCNNPGTATFSAARMSTTTSTLSEPAPTVGKGRTRVH